jgi:hypothetical protein
MSVRSVEFSSQTREMPVYNACRSGLASGAPRQRPFVRPFSAQASRCPGQWLPRSLADVICFSPDRGSTVTPLTLPGLCWTDSLAPTLDLVNCTHKRPNLQTANSRTLFQTAQERLVFSRTQNSKMASKCPHQQAWAWVCVGVCLSLFVCLRSCRCVLVCLRTCVPACLRACLPKLL